jgi:hypothetical protein
MFLVGIAMLFMFTIGAFFEEGVAFFDPVYTTIMSDLEYYLSLIAVLLSVTCFLLLVHRYYTIKINWVFLSIALTWWCATRLRFDLSLRLYDDWDKREG